MLDNEKYMGRWVWNKTEQRRDPRTGRRRCFPKPASEWVIQEDKSLRIVPQDLWEQVRTRRKESEPELAWWNRTTRMLLSAGKSGEILPHALAQHIEYVLRRVEAEVGKLYTHVPETIHLKEIELTAEERRLVNFVDFIGEGRGSRTLAQALLESERKVGALKEELESLRR
jgi:hypothetical protein